MKDVGGDPNNVCSYKIFRVKTHKFARVSIKANDRSCQRVKKRSIIKNKSILDTNEVKVNQDYQMSGSLESLL